MKSEYAPLGQYEDEAQTSPCCKSRGDASLHPWVVRIFTWACVACTVCSLVNLGFYVAELGSLVSRVSPAAPKRLPRPSSYIGLESVLRNASDMPPLKNFPSFMSQISKEHPTLTFPEDVGRHLTVYGSVSPDEQRLQLTPDITTIAQFRVHDFGMERCKVVATIPANPIALFEASPKRLKTYTLSGDTTNVQVWLLDSDPYVELNTLHLTYATRPARRTLLGSLHVAEDHMSSTPEFPCPSGSLQTVEYVCTGPSCNIEFYQYKRYPVATFYMVQMFSLNTTSAGM